VPLRYLEGGIYSAFGQSLALEIASVLTI
jgi:hypothetical protein